MTKKSMAIPWRSLSSFLRKHSEISDGRDGNREMFHKRITGSISWNEFSEMLLLLLPILNSSSMKSLFRPFSKDKFSGSEGDDILCPICKANPTIAYVALPCHHRNGPCGCMIVALAIQLFFPKTLILMLATFDLIICYKEKEWDIEQLMGSGGMPSSHSTTVTALADCSCCYCWYFGWYWWH
ncbi:unnamed protein product [Lactuca saligna]|uniref:Uncharacterized protein n=1 Tax=Lactuca saligna TaxID=75948 RepID=A0AA36A1U8_LACSI|nr:unnamed protein product [Lactuca saligna]